MRERWDVRGGVGEDWMDCAGCVAGKAAGKAGGVGAAGEVTGAYCVGVGISRRGTGLGLGAGVVHAKLSTCEKAAGVGDPKTSLRGEDLRFFFARGLSKL